MYESVEQKVWGLSRVLVYKELTACNDSPVKVEIINIENERNGAARLRFIGEQSNIDALHRRAARKLNS